MKDYIAYYKNANGEVEDYPFVADDLKGAIEEAVAFENSIPTIDLIQVEEI